MPDDPQPLRRGEFLTARWLTALAKRARLGNLRAAPPLTVWDDGQNMVIGFDRNAEAVFKITSGSNPYGGIRQTPTTGGGWTDDATLTVTTSNDPLYEANGNVSVPANLRVLAKRVYPSRAWVFHAPGCTGGVNLTPSPPPAGPTSPTPPSTQTPAGPEFPIPPSTGSDPLEGGGTIPGNPDGMGVVIQPSPLDGVIAPDVPPGTPVTVLLTTAPPTPAGPGGGSGLSGSTPS